MDESDKITIPILRSIGCALPPLCEDMHAIDKALLFNCVATCLNKMEPSLGLEIWTKLPSSIGKQSRMAEALLRGCQQLGCEWAAFNSLVYPTADSSRQLLRWLVERLPATGGDANEDEAADEELSLSDKVVVCLQQWAAGGYSELHSATRRRTAALRSVDLRPHWHESASGKHLAWLCHQPPHAAEVLPSLVALNTNAMAAALAARRALDTDDAVVDEETGGQRLATDTLKDILVQDWAQSSAPQRRVKLKGKRVRGQSQAATGGLEQTASFSSLLRKAEFTQQSTASATMIAFDGSVLKVDDSGIVAQNEEEAEAQREASLKTGRAKVEKVLKQLAKGRTQISATKARIAESRVALESEKRSVEELTADCKAKIKTLKLVPDALGNLGKLAAIVSESGSKLALAKRKWEKRKSAFVSALESRKQSFLERKARANDLSKEAQRMRVAMRRVAEELQSKDELTQAIVSRLNAMPATVNRQIYVERILGVVHSLEAQKRQIDSIVADVRQLQKETARLSQQSKRTFAMTDDLVFVSAQKCADATLRKSLNQLYRQIVNIRERFDQIIDAIKQVSNLRNELRDFTHQSDALREKVDALDIDKVLSDMSQVETENQEMAKRLKALKKLLKAKAAEDS